MIDVAERNALKKLATNKQTIFLIILAAVFSPAVIGICYCLFKIGKLEDEKFKIMIESIGLVLFALSLSLFAREIFLYNIVNCISLKSMK